MPKKVKKGAGGRSGGRTEEEKLLQLQQRAQSEREMEKKKEEILTLFLKVNQSLWIKSVEHLSEENFTEVTKVKVLFSFSHM